MREIRFSERFLSLKETEEFAGQADSRGKGLIYRADTGRSWGEKHSVRGVMRGSRTVPVETTDDLVEWIGSASEEGLYLPVHLERWARGEREWLISSSKDAVVISGKIF